MVKEEAGTVRLAYKIIDIRLCKVVPTRTGQLGNLKILLSLGGLASVGNESSANT